MELFSARLKGFIGIKKGLNLDEVAVDLSGVSGLVAFDGPNGKGKSTLLENLQPFRTLASRKGALAHHVFMRDSEKALTFGFQGDEYRTLIKIDAQSERQEGFIWRNGQPQVNGKVSTYDAYIEELLGSSRLFFSSVFCAQGSAKISDLTTGELKGLFSEFLRLQRYIDFETTSKQCNRVLTGSNDSLQENVRRLELALNDLAGCRDNLTASRNEFNQREGVIVQKQGLLEKVSSELVTAKEAASKNTVLRIQLAGLRAGKPDLLREREDCDTKSQAELSGLREKARSMVDQIKDHEALLSDKEQVMKAADQKAELAGYLQMKREALGKVQGDLLKFSQEVHQIATLLAAHRSDILDLKSNPKRTQLINDIAVCESKAGNLKKRDPNCKSEICSFIVDALEAQEKLPGLKERLKVLEAETDKKVEEKFQASLDTERDLKKAQKAESDAFKAQDSLVSEVVKIEAELERITALAEKLPKIEAAETRLDDLRKRKDELIADGMEAKERWDKLRISILDRLVALDDQIDDIEKQIDAEADQKVIEKGRMIEDLKTEISIKQEVNVSLTKTVATLEQKVFEQDAATTELNELREKQKKLVHEASEWKYIQDACSKDGLRALEIDSVAPVITGYANDLLNNTFGPNFSVRFRTQDDEGREVLDILVIRSDGSEALLDNLSGGERVWCLKALRLAMTLISKEKSGKDYKCLLCDEEDGALSRDNAVQFIQLYRTLLNMAGMEACFYISHRAEAIGLADHTISFNGGISIE